MKHLGSVCVVLLCMLFSSLSSAVVIQQQDSLETSAYKYTEMVMMRDGIHLATDIYLPYEGFGDPHPVVLVRTPYDKSASDGAGYADAGWPAVVQDMRGRYASEGVDTVFMNSHTDGPDTLEWIANQPWCDGKVITVGGSALGINQYYMAGAGPSELAGQYVSVATPDLHKHAMFQGGQFRSALVEMWLEGQQSLFALPYFLENENFSLDAWTNVSLVDNWQQVNVPSIHIGGWYDCFCQGTIDAFMGYQYEAGPDARGNAKLVMGPWTHGIGDRQAGQLLYPENAVDLYSWQMFEDLAFEFGLGVPSGFEQWPAVSYYVMGDVSNPDAPGNEWRFSEMWPVPSEEVSVFFASDGSLVTSAEEENSEFMYQYDPSNPVPSLGGQNLCIARGPYDQGELESRDDVLIFTSEILEEPVEATGQIKARLFVSSNQPDTDFTVKLCDVYPDGRSMLITDGILRMRNREGRDHWEFMQPDVVYEVEVDMWSTSYVWDAGHQIRVAVSSSNAPRFEPNTNTMDSIFEIKYGEVSPVVADNTLYVGGNYASCLLLPIVEATNGSGNAPGKPLRPSGPVDGKIHVEHTYQSKAVDLDGDELWYTVDWGDGSFTGWFGPYASDEVVSFSHSWEEQGSFSVKIKAKDGSSLESEWSEPLAVSMPRMFSWSDFFEILLENFPFVAWLYSLCV